MIDRIENPIYMFFFLLLNGEGKRREERDYSRPLRIIIKRLIQSHGISVLVRSRGRRMELEIEGEREEKVSRTESKECFIVLRRDTREIDRGRRQISSEVI